MGRALLSACLIVRDEEQRLGRCLTALAAIADEIVVADTGSTDHSRTLARKFGARVIDFPWRDDFAAARNAALEAARGAWILVVDADEILESPERERIRRLLRETGVPAFSVEVVSPHGEGLEETAHLTRLFRNDPRHRYRGRIHEQILPSICERLGREGWLPPRSGLRLRHEGYLPGVRESRGKLERNRRLLRAEIAERPDDPAPRFFLARENCPSAGGDLLDLPATREALALISPAVESMLERPAGALTDPIVTLGIRLAVVTGDEARAARWSRGAEERLGPTAGWLYAEGERLLALAADGDLSAAALAGERFGAAMHAPDGSPLLATARELRRRWAPLRRDLARAIAGLSPAGEAAGADEAEAAIAAAWRRAHETGDPGAVLAPLADGLRRRASDPRAWLALACALRISGETGRAGEAVETALRIAPGWSAATELKAGRPHALRGLLAPWRRLVETPRPAGALQK